MTETLNSVCEFIVDCLHATAPVVEDGYPLIRTPNIGKGRLDLNGVYRVTDEVYEKWTQRAIPQDNDLIFAREATAGNIAIIKGGERVCLGQRTVLLRPNPDKIDPDFLCYYLLGPEQQSRLLSGATGATAAHVNMKDIRKLTLINMPHIQIQRKIGEILSAYDDLIENNTRRIQLLEESVRHLYEEWFIRLRFPGYEHTTIEDGVPEGWTICQLKDISPQIRDGVEPKNIDPLTPYIGLEHIPRRSISLNIWGKAGDVTSRKFAYSEGDLLFGKIRPYFHKVGITFNNGVTSSDAIVLRPIDKKFQNISLLTTSSDIFVAETSKTAKEGSKMPRANWELMEQKLILIPPTSQLTHFNSIIDPILIQLKTLSMSNIQLKLAKDLLLPRLISGEIPV